MADNLLKEDRRKTCLTFGARILSQKRLLESSYFQKAFDTEKMYEPCLGALILFCQSIIL